MKEDAPGNARGRGGGILSWGRVCDTCGTAACAVYCLADSAYLCSACDARIHAANRLASRHECARVCESCERAPAAFLCKADAASLCVACDAEVHSANTLARRHHRVPILFPSPPGHVNPPLFSSAETVDEEEEEEDEEAASWLLMDQGNAGNFLDLVEYSNSAAEDRYVDVKSYRGNGVVPLKNGDGGEGYDQVQQQQHLFLGLEFEQVSKSVHGHGHTISLSHSISLSSMDMSVVPDSPLSDISVAPPRPPKGTIDLFSGPPAQVPVQLTGVDREARVMRYREKKKTRKFEKTIRYASRKAYAETRPRIKGRFAREEGLNRH